MVFTGIKPKSASKASAPLNTCWYLPRQSMPRQPSLRSAPRNRSCALQSRKFLRLIALDQKVAQKIKVRLANCCPTIVDNGAGMPPHTFGAQYLMLSSRTLTEKSESDH